MPRPTPAQSPRRPATSASAASARNDGEGTVRFSAQNWILIVAGLVSIVAGYFLLDGGSVDLAPALLVLGYVILIPLGIIWQGRDREKGA
jgi:hypothetical protein